MEEKACHKIIEILKDRTWVRTTRSIYSHYSFLKADIIAEVSKV
jgi:hypothetical protein